MLAGVFLESVMNSLAKNCCIGLSATTGTEPDFRSDGKTKLHVSVTIVIDVRLQVNWILTLPLANDMIDRRYHGSHRYLGDMN